MLARLSSPWFVLAAAALLSLSSETRAIDPPAAPPLQASVSRDDASAESRWQAAAEKVVASRASAQAASDAGWPAGADPRGPYEPPAIDRVWVLPARPGFPGARGVEGHATHRAPCEAARCDLKVMAFTLTGEPTTIVVR